MWKYWGFEIPRHVPGKVFVIVVNITIQGVTNFYFVVLFLLQKDRVCLESLNNILKGLNIFFNQSVNTVWFFQ